MCLEHSSYSVNTRWMTKLYVNWDAAPQRNQTRVDFDDLHWHGVSNCFLDLRIIGPAEVSVSTVWELAPRTGQDAGAHPCLSQSGHVGRILPPRAPLRTGLTSAAGAPSAHSAPSPGSSVALKQPWPCAAIPSRVHSTFPLPPSSTPLPPYTPAPQGTAWILWGFPRWGLCSCSSFCPECPYPQ